MVRSAALLGVVASGCLLGACQGSAGSSTPAAPAGSCFTTTGKTRYCGGAAPSPQVLAQYGKDVPVCNECLADSACVARAGGKCKTIPARSCDGQSEMRCVYPGDPCFADTCPDGTRCALDGQGLAVKPGCVRPEPPRP